MTEAFIYFVAFTFWLGLTVGLSFCADPKLGKPYRALSLLIIFFAMPFFLGVVIMRSARCLLVVAEAVSKKGE